MIKVLAYSPEANFISRFEVDSNEYREALANHLLNTLQFQLDIYVLVDINGTTCWFHMEYIYGNRGIYLNSSAINGMFMVSTIDPLDIVEHIEDVFEFMEEVKHEYIY